MSKAKGKPGLRSMTGFGSARAQVDDLAIEVEARSVNHRHLKVNSRVPEAVTALIPQIDERVRAFAARGTVTIHVRVTHTGGQDVARLNEPLLRRLHTELTKVANELGVEPPTLGAVAALPGVVLADELSLEPAKLWPVLAPVVESALTELDTMRREEGAGIGQDLEQMVAEMTGVADQVEGQVPRAVQEQSDRLRTRVKHLLEETAVSLEPDDLAREIALLAEKSDISEELQRFRSHLDQVESALAKPSGPLGRKLEFIAQELVREANTMASKSHDSALVNLILSLKLSVERIREQVANVE